MKARHEFANNAEYEKYLRAYFAAMAMQGLLANLASDSNFRVNDWGIDSERIANNATYCADALINALNPPTNEQ